MGIIISHYKDPYEPTSIMESKTSNKNCPTFCEEPVPQKVSGTTTPATGLPGQRMEKRAAERLERQKRDRQKGALAKEDQMMLILG